MAFLGLTKATIEDGKFVNNSTVDFGTVEVTVPNGAASAHDKNGNIVSFSHDVLSFKGKGGEYDFGDVVSVGVDDGTVTLSAISFADASTVTVGGGIESFIGSSKDDEVSISSTNADLVINLGAGDDIISGDGKGQTVTLGKGKDTIGVTGEITVSDYDYKQDKIDGLNALSATGIAGTTGATITIGEEGKDVYYAQDTGGNYFATAGEDANAKIALALDAATTVAANIHAAATIDARSALKAEVNLTGNGAAEVTLGNKNEMGDVLTVGTGSKETLSVTVTNFETGEEVHDKLVLSGAKLNDDLAITLDAGTKITYKDATVVLKGVTTSGVIDFNDTTMAFAVAADQTLKDSTAELFYGFEDGGDTVLEVSKSTYLNVNTANYKNIHNIILNEDVIDVAGLQIGGSKEDDTIDVGNSEVGVEVYGGGGSDSITLSEGADVLWVSNKDKGTADVGGFKYGSVNEADTLYLFDTAKLTDIKLAGDANTIAVTAGKSNANLNDVTLATDDVKSEILKVKLADNNTYNVLTHISADDHVTLDAADQESLNFFVLYKDGATIDLTGEEGTSSFLNSGYTDVYTGKLTGVNGEEMKGDMSIGYVEQVTLGTGTNEYWAYGNGTVSLTNTGEDGGVDTIWFKAGIDKKVEVQGFDAENDSIKLLGATDAASVVDAYKFTVDDGTVITGIGTASKMKLNVIDEPITVKTDTEEFQISVADDGTAEFADGISIYAGMDEIEVTDEVVGPVVVGMGTASSKVMGGAVFISDSVQTFNASTTDAVTVVRGSETKASTIYGGNTKNDMYGGGATKDTLYGNDNAVDTFWFGANEGVDTIYQVDASDSVYLWNVSSADIASVVVTADASEAKLTIGAGSVLHINDDGLTNDGVLTFTTSDGANFVYDAEKKQLVAKQ